MLKAEELTVVLTYVNLYKNTASLAKLDITGSASAKALAKDVCVYYPTIANICTGPMTVKAIT